MTIEEAMVEMSKIADRYWTAKIEMTHYHTDEEVLEYSVYGYRGKKSFWSKEAGSFEEAIADWQKKVKEYLNN